MMPNGRPTPNGASSLIEALLELGVDTVFGYPGGAVLPIYDALHDQPALRHILVRHEQAAVHAAQGYARTTGKVGVAFVTSGPGVSNTTTGLLDCLCDSVPVVCISGQVASDSIGTDAFQECDALGISRPVTKWSAQAREASAIRPLVRRAFDIASGPRPGPVLLDIPKDVQVQALASASHHRSQTRRPRAGSTHHGSFPVQQLRRAIALIAQSQRPVIYGGGGLVNSGQGACDLFKELVELTAAPCALTLMGLGAYPASDQKWLGMLGMHGTLEANLAMHHAEHEELKAERDKMRELRQDVARLRVDLDRLASINEVLLAENAVLRAKLDDRRVVDLSSKTQNRIQA